MKTSSSNIVRRSFLKLSGGAAVAAGTLGGFATRAFAQSDAKVFRMAWPGSPQILDPAGQRLLEEYQFTALVYENLTELDPNGVPVPLLATEWTVSEDGLTWEMTLVEGATFHSGKVMTSADVVYTFERLIDPAQGLKGKSFFSFLKQVEAIDDAHVRFHLNYPYADLLTALALSYCGILPEGADTGTLANAPDGTGPYKVAEFVPGSRVVYAPHDGYRDPEAIGFSEIRQETIAQDTSQVSMLRGSQVDFVSQIAPQLVAGLEKDPKVSLLRSPGAGFHALYMNAADPRFAPVQVRQAIKMMLNRDALAQIGYAGQATPKGDNVVLSSNQFYDPTVPIPQPDLAAAKALMAEGGYPDGFTADFYTTTERFGLQQLSVGVAAMLEPLGIKLNIVTLTNSDLGTQVYRKKELAAFYFSAMVGADQSIAPFYESNGTHNGGGTEPPYFSDPELDALFLAGKEETDPEKRAEIYHKLQHMTAERGYIVVPYEFPLVVASTPKLQNFAPSSRGYHDFKHVTFAG